jgi:predicted  nucleic acid-binding Zn-ribbon protein
MLDEVDALESEVAKLTSTYEENKQALAEREKEVREHYKSLEEREAEKIHERQQFLEVINPQHLAAYDRLRERHPMDAIVPVTDTRQCSGCFMQLGPQVVVEIARAKKLIRCPGCGRILYLDKAE